MSKLSRALCSFLACFVLSTLFWLMNTHFFIFLLQSERKEGNVNRLVVAQPHTEPSRCRLMLSHTLRGW